MVYLVLDNAGFRVYKIPYSVIHAESVKYKWKTVEVMSDKGLCYKLEKHPALQKSFNRTGWFVKVMFEEYRVI
jgi:hypothetical protein